MAFDARLIRSLGIGRYISGLLPPLAQSLGGRLTVFCGPEDVALLRGMLGGTARIQVARERPYHLAEQTTFLARLAASRPALAHFPHYNLPIAFLGQFIVTIHDLFSHRFPDIHSGWLPRSVNRLLISNAVRRAAAIIVPSGATANAISSTYPFAQRRVNAIAEAADGRFTPSRNSPAESSWQRYFGIRPPYFLYLGQWKAYKNVPLLIEAFARVITQRPGVQLVVAGHDRRHPEIARPGSAFPPGSFVLPGHLPDDAVPDLYRGAAALVLPSRDEGFGLPVLEAMACGVSVVCSDIPALREIADEVAYFCDPSSSEAFAASMLSALDHPDARRIQRGLDRASEFSWARAAKETLAVYERVLVGRERTRSATD